MPKPCRFVFTVFLGTMFLGCATRTRFAESNSILINANYRQPSSTCEYPRPNSKAPKGLATEEITVGDGELAETGREIVVNNTFWIWDDNKEDHKGEKVESTVENGQPFVLKFDANSLMEGWYEGVRGMRVHGKRKIIVPPSLGFKKSVGPVCSEDSLIFEVELIGVR